MSRLSPVGPAVLLASFALAGLAPTAHAEMTTIDARWRGTIEIVREGIHHAESAGNRKVAINVRQHVLYELDGGEVASAKVTHRERMETGTSTVFANGEGEGQVYAGAGFVDDGANGRFYKRGWYLITHGVPLATLVDVPEALQQVEVAPGVYLETPDDYREQETLAVTLVLDGATSLQALKGQQAGQGLIQSVFLGSMEGTETVTWNLQRLR